MPLHYHGLEGEIFQGVLHAQELNTANKLVVNMPAVCLGNASIYLHVVYKCDHLARHMTVHLDPTTVPLLHNL